MATRTPRRGRPPKSEGTDTRQRLVEAAAAACADRGFDGATLQEIARRVGVTATAVYNHFDGREALLYEAGVWSLGRMTEAVPEPTSFGEVAAAYLHPDMAEPRRFLSELHVAARRDEDLAQLLHGWHVAIAAEMARLRPADPEPLATAKALFLVLLGLCHLEDLDAVTAAPDALARRVTQMVEALRATT